MEIIAAVAIGLNPYVGTFVLLALAAFTDRLPDTALLQAMPPLALGLAAAGFGLAAPVDFVLGKVLRFAVRARRLSQIIAPPVAGLLAALVGLSDLPVPLVVVGAAALAWGVAAMVTALAARASRSPAWVGLGHVPILMAAATGSACVIPLGVANTTVGWLLSSATLVVLLTASLTGRKPAPAGGVAPPLPVSTRAQVR